MGIGRIKFSEFYTILSPHYDLSKWFKTTFVFVDQQFSAKLYLLPSTQEMKWRRDYYWFLGFSPRAAEWRPCVGHQSSTPGDRNMQLGLRKMFLEASWLERPWKLEASNTRSSSISCYILLQCMNHISHSRHVSPFSAPVVRELIVHHVLRTEAA